MIIISQKHLRNLNSGLSVDSSNYLFTDLIFMGPCIVNVFLSTTNKMQRYTIFFIVVSALHVSSGFSAHHQELKNCTCVVG